MLAQRRLWACFSWAPFSDAGGVEDSAPGGGDKARGATGGATGTWGTPWAWWFQPTTFSDARYDCGTNANLIKSLGAIHQPQQYTLHPCAIFWFLGFWGKSSCKSYCRLLAKKNAKNILPAKKKNKSTPSDGKWMHPVANKPLQCWQSRRLRKVRCLPNFLKSKANENDIHTKHKTAFGNSLLISWLPFFGKKFQLYRGHLEIAHSMLFWTTFSQQTVVAW